MDGRGRRGTVEQSRALVITQLKTSRAEGTEPNATAIVIKLMPGSGAPALVVDKSQQQVNALSAAEGMGVPVALLPVVSNQRGDRCHRSSRTWAAPLSSTLKDLRAHSRRRPRYVALTLIAPVIAAGLWLLPAPLIRTAAAWWVVSDPLTPADAVLVLGGGFDRRPLAAAALYRRGLVKRVVIAQVARPATPAAPAAPSELARSRAAIIAEGVPAAAIAPFGKDVASTYDEASAAAEWVAAHGARRLIVPTDWYHTRRVSWVFRALVPPGVAISVVALPPPGSAGISGDWSSLTMIAREALKYCYYRIRYHGAVREATNVVSPPA